MDRAAARRIGGGLLLLAIMGIAVWPATVSAEDEASDRSTRSSTTTAGPATRSAKPAATASSNNPNAKLEAKLDQILANQEQIFRRFDEVMEELRIVKVRATLRGS